MHAYCDEIVNYHFAFIILLQLIVCVWLTVLATHFYRWMQTAVSFQLTMACYYKG